LDFGGDFTQGQIDEREFTAAGFQLHELNGIMADVQADPVAAFQEIQHWRLSLLQRL
jgi:hypothetical protein